LTDMTAFLIANYRNISISGIESYIGFNNLLFSLMANVLHDQDELQSNAQRVARLVLAQFEVFLKFVEKTENPERGLAVLNAFRIRLQRDLPNLSQMFAPKSVVVARLSNIDRECQAVMAAFVSQPILSRALRIRERAMADTLMDRLLVGAHVLPMLEEAQRILEPFSARMPDLMGEILTEVGLAHLNLFQDFDAAETKLEDAKKMEDFLQPDLPFPVWTSRASAGLRRIFSIRVNPPSLNVDQVIMALKVQHRRGERHLIEHALLRHPPKHSKLFLQEEWMKPIGVIDNALRMKLMKMYLTDTIVETKENRSYLKICGEIEKYLRSFFGSD